MKRILLFLFLIPAPLFAGYDNYPFGGRSAGLAHASVTLQDAWSASNNQAGLAWMKNIEVGAYYENRFQVKELGLAAAVFILPVKKGTFALSYRQFGYTDYSENKAGLAYAMKIGERVSAGIQVNYQTLRLGDVYGSKSLLTAELGLQAKLSKELTMGVHLYNPLRVNITESPLEYVPTILRVGLDYRFSDKLFVAAEVLKDIDHPIVFKTGAEYRLHEMFSLRAGLSTNPVLNTFGFGLYLKNFVFDIAAGYHQVLGITSQAGISFRFKGVDKMVPAE
jgi:hypothetical protein